MRFVAILDLVAERRVLSMHELVSALGVSPASVRRDLVELERRRLIARTHGHVRALDEPEIPPALRRTRGEVFKRRIARAVADRLPDERCAVALSGGTTTAAVAAELIGRQRLTLVTNSLTIAELVHSQPSARIVLTGGALRPQSLEMVGPIAEHTFSGFNVGWAILGADGVDAEAGVTTHDDTEARTNRAMMTSAQRTIVVADGSKIGMVTLAQMVPIGDVDLLVTDTSADTSHLDRIRAAGIEVVVVSDEVII
ncbi:DeoR/GlpR family DNA-binding transcription regulator [Microbacterium sp.]|uniref:DeoR/GlpR family DNA-binding transcription regulator n=1 Tax=Microbacterium sp. TaxID=51671 RepID=UPI003C779A9A